jgi:cytochrome c oxidase cbb3-type subunit 3
MEDKNSTGPKLKGAKALWESAGEGELIYKWVENSATLIKTGKSKRAKEIQAYSPTEMPAQTVTKEEVDAILGYVDSYEPALEKSTATVGDSTATGAALIEKPNYSENLDLFYGLLFIALIIGIGILVIAYSIVTYVKSDYFKSKATNQGTLPVTILILSFGYIGFSSQSLALNFMSSGEATEKMPWLLVENSDIYVLLFIDMLLIAILLYLRNIFNRLVAMTKSKEALALEETPVINKLNAILTDAVPIEREHEIMMDHEYDGIRELDNNLPPWWVWGFYATIVFAIIYIVNYHIVGYSDLQIKAYDKEMVQADKEVKAYLSAQAMNVDETNATLLTESQDLAEGKNLFSTHCVTCHKSKGEGDVGPNLTDKSWIYGYDIKEVFASIKKGRPAGMPEHASKLNPVQIQQVASYVINLPYIKGTKPEQGTIKEK